MVHGILQGTYPPGIINQPATTIHRYTANHQQIYNFRDYSTSIFHFTIIISDIHIDRIYPIQTNQQGCLTIMIYNLYAYQVPLSPLIGCLSPILPLLYPYSFAIQQPHYSKISNLDIMQETSSNSHRGSTIFGIILTILCKELARYIHHRPSHSPSFFDRKPYPSYLTCKLTVRYAKPTTSTLQQQFHPASHP